MAPVRSGDPRHPDLKSTYSISEHADVSDSGYPGTGQVPGRTWGRVGDSLFRLAPYGLAGCVGAAAAAASAGTLGAGSLWCLGSALGGAAAANLAGTFQHARVRPAAPDSIAVAKENTIRAVVESSGDLLFVLDHEGNLLHVGESVTRILGLEAETLRGLPMTSIVHPDDASRCQDFVRALDEQRLRLRVTTVDGSWRIVEWVRATPVDEAGTIILTGRDVSGQVALERELLHQATHDTLTGLPNRKALMDVADRAVAEAAGARPVAVLMIDLDRFKDVNDSLGHAVGDQLLAQVGPRLREVLRPSDTIARLGGDEFAVLLPGADAVAARMVADRLGTELDEAFVIDGMDLRVEASIGIAVSLPAKDDAPSTVASLLREADIAMYRAKESGTGVAIFDPERDNEQSRSRLELSAELRRAIGEGQLVLFYQPVVDVISGDLAGVEALVRWRHPSRGLLPPSEFLPLAEQTGLVVGLSRTVLDEAISQIARWRDDGRTIQVAVNLSPRWLQVDDVPAAVADKLSQYQVPARALRLELTESVVLADPQETLPMLLRLREMGVRLSLDDFGTGYSSMTHLRSLPVDELKVDRAFVQAMVTTPEDAVIVRMAIELGHNLGMSVVAEGVETSDVLAEVVASGCSLAQGYYFARPLPADELTSWVDARFPGSQAAADPTRASIVA